MYTLRLPIQKDLRQRRLCSLLSKTASRMMRP